MNPFIDEALAAHWPATIRSRRTLPGRVTRWALSRPVPVVGRMVVVVNNLYGYAQTLSWTPPVTDRRAAESRALEQSR